MIRPRGLPRPGLGGPSLGAAGQTAASLRAELQGKKNRKDIDAAVNRPPLLPRESFRLEPLGRAFRSLPI